MDTVIKVLGPEVDEPTHVDVLDGSNLQARYDRLLALVLRLGGWLSSTQAQLLTREQWEHQYALYQKHLSELQELGDQLRPQSLRGRMECLAGDALLQETLEIFAA